MKERKLLYISLLVIVCCLIRDMLGQAGILGAYNRSQIEKVISCGEDVTLTGQIYKIEQSLNNQVLYLKDISISYQNQSIKESKIIIYHSNTEHPLSVGNRIICCGEINCFERERNPGAFDQMFYYQKQGILLYMSADRITVCDETQYWMREKLRHIKKWGTEICRMYAGDTYGGILSAMLVGEKAFLDDRVKELYQRGGIAHILSISGLHLSFLGNGIYQSVRKASGSYLFGGIVGICVLGCYSLMLGFHVSAVRALVMLVVKIGADMTGRVYDPATAIALAAAVLSAGHPFAVMDGGFQLSFGAIIGIYYVSPALFKKSGEKSKLSEAIKGSLAVQMMTVPILLYHFYEISLYSILLNLLVIPLVGVLLVLAVGAIGSVLFLEPVAEILFLLCCMILKGYAWLCDYVLELPCARCIWGKPEELGWIFYYACLILMIKKRNSMRCVRRILLAGAGLGVLYLSCPRGATSDLEITMLDVGQGDCICLQKGKMVCLIDGGSTSMNQIGKYQIEPFLKSKGIAEIDGVFLSHGDEDHINGITELLERQKLGIPIRSVIVSEKVYQDESLLNLKELAEKQGVPTLLIKAGEGLEKDELKISCLFPGGNTRVESGNESSMVLDVTYKKFRMLFTGDLEGIGENMLTDSLQKSYVALKVSHHGSGNSTQEEFLNKVCPKYAFISAGENNRYGHPHKETLIRLEEKNCVVYSTIKSGAVTIKTDGKKMRVEEYVKEKE